MGFDFLFDTPATLPASRSHRDNVGCVMPTSRDSAFAEIAPGPDIRSTIRARKPSVYSVIFPGLLAPRGSFSRGGNYPDAGGKPRSRTILVTVEDETMATEIGVNYPLVRPHRIYQVALRCGLRTLRADPDRLVREALDALGSNGETPAGGAQ